MVFNSLSKFLECDPDKKKRKLTYFVKIIDHKNQGFKIFNSIINDN